MKNYIVLIFILILFLSCQKDTGFEKEDITYSGFVFSYKEIEGEDLIISESIFTQGTPHVNIGLKLKQFEYSYVGGVCCWTTRTGSKTLCSTQTDENGYFECNLTEHVDDYEISNPKFDRSKMFYSNRDSIYILQYNTTKVAVTVIDSSQATQDGEVFDCRALHPSVAFEGFRFRADRGNLIGNNRVYTDTLRVMENVNMDLKYSKNNGDNEYLRFFTGDKSNPQTLTFYL